MESTAGTQAAAGAFRVLSLGVDRATEAGLLQRFASLPMSEACPFVASDDFEHCDAMVVDTGSPMLFVARRTAALRPEMILLTLDADGILRNAREDTCPGLDSAALSALFGGSDPARPPTDAPVAHAVPSPLAATMAPAPPHAAGAQTPLAERLRGLMVSANGHAQLLLDGEVVVLLDFDRKLAVPVLSAADALPALLAKAFARLWLETVTSARFNAGHDIEQALPVAPLLWAVAQHMETDAAPLPPLSTDSVLSLRQWPDFRALAHRHDHFRLCCLLLKRPSTAREASRLLGIDNAVVTGFFNAAYLSGYADISQAPARVAAVAQPRRAGSTLARMWRSVRQGLQGAST